MEVLPRCSPESVQTISNKKGSLLHGKNHTKYTNRHLEELKKELAQYTGNGQYVFKTCAVEWIVVLQRTTETETNESRPTTDPKYARFRGSEFTIVLIVNKFNPLFQIKKIHHDIPAFTHEHPRTIEYVVGVTMCIDNYDQNINVVDAPGIHFYRSLEAAFYYSINRSCKYTGIYKLFDADGKLLIMTEVSNKINRGTEYRYHDNKLAYISCLPDLPDRSIKPVCSQFIYNHTFFKN